MTASGRDHAHDLVTDVGVTDRGQGHAVATTAWKENVKTGIITCHRNIMSESEYIIYLNCTNEENMRLPLI